MLLLPVAMVALALRALNHQVMGWSPDTYDRLFDARAIVSGELPSSPVYLPGAAVLIAPLFAFLPDTLETMQWVTIASGVAMVPITYKWVLCLTDDRRAAFMAACLVALFPPLVYHSRGAQYDVQSLLLTMLALVYAPGLRKASPLGWIAYGCGLALLVNIRPSNIVIVPALALLFVAEGASHNRRELIRRALHPSVLVVGGVTIVFCVASVVLGEWSQGSGETEFSLDRVWSNLLEYVYVSAGRGFGVFLLVPFAAIAGRRLWRQKPFHLAAVAYVLVALPVAFAPFDFVSDRYMLPSQVLVISLAAIGLSSVLWAPDAGSTSSVWLLRSARITLVLLVAIYSLGAGLVVKTWPDRVAESDEGLAAEFRPTVHDLPEGSLLVSAVSLPFHDDAPQLNHYNLVYSAMRGGGAEATVDELLAAIDGHLRGGERVYYLYSHWEQGSDFTMKGKLGYATYWDSVTASYDILRIQEGTRVRVTDHTWTLYELRPKN